MSKKIALIFSGCGVYDGTEIHEGILAMLSIMKQGAGYTIFAPDMEQHHVIDHTTGNEMPEKRNVLIESARIARGKIRPLSEFNIDDFDALMLPGGFGGAKNLSTLAFDGPNCTVNAELETAVKATVAAGKPIGALCIMPAVIAKILPGAKLTVGHSDVGVIGAIGAMGGNHKATDHGQVVIDEKYKLATTPCYMEEANLLQIEEGAMNITKAVLAMC